MRLQGAGPVWPCSQNTSFGVRSRKAMCPSASIQRQRQIEIRQRSLGSKHVARQFAPYTTRDVTHTLCYADISITFGVSVASAARAVPVKLV